MGWMHKKSSGCVLVALSLSVSVLRLSSIAFITRHYVVLLLLLFSKLYWAGNDGTMMKKDRDSRWYASGCDITNTASLRTTVIRTTIPLRFTTSRLLRLLPLLVSTATILRLSFIEDLDLVDPYPTTQNNVRTCWFRLHLKSSDYGRTMTMTNDDWILMFDVLATSYHVRQTSFLNRMSVTTWVMRFVPTYAPVERTNDY